MYANMYGHVCNLTIHVSHECCFIYGYSRIYGHPWLYTWHVGILDQVYAYMYIYGFDNFSDGVTWYNSTLQRAVLLLCTALLGSHSSPPAATSNMSTIQKRFTQSKLHFSLLSGAGYQGVLSFPLWLSRPPFTALILGLV